MSILNGFFGGGNALGGGDIPGLPPCMNPCIPHTFICLGHTIIIIRVSYRIFCWGGRSNCKGCSSVRIILNFKISGRGEMWLGGGIPGRPPLCMKP